MIQKYNISRQEKINIHIPIRGETYYKCIDFNSRFLAVGENDINFSFNSMQKPHITLCMAYICSDNSLEEVLKEVSILAKNSKPFIVRLGHLYFSSWDYLFLGLEASEEILSLRKSLKEIISPHVISVKQSTNDVAPHITIGYSRNRSSFEELIQTPTRGENLLCEALEVSFCGGRGSCLGSIKTFEFN